MSASIPETILLSDLLKSTGFDCPSELQGLTFTEATVGENVPAVPNKLFAYREHYKVVYLKAIPSEDTAEVNVYEPEATGFSGYSTGSYTKETDTVTVGSHDYARYAGGDFQI